MGKIAYTAKQVFTGIDMLLNHAVVVEEGIIENVVPVVTLPKDMDIKSYGDGVIAPSFIDLQLYGAYGRLLSVYPDAETLAATVDYCRKGGAAYCMPTVATNTYDVIFKCIDAIRDYWKQGDKGVLGLHVEGPWISKAKRGAHIEELIFSPTLEQAKELLEYGNDVIKMITLAPEECSQEIIDLICSYNIVISAGHSSTSYKTAMHAFDSGINAVTHLFNAMSAFQHREPGLVGAAFDHKIVRASIIPDGHHVDYTALRIAKKIMGERLFVITDAVTETGKGPYQHMLAGDKYEANGVLSGSALTMQKAVYNLVNHADIPLSEALRMCSLYPARILNSTDDHALIKAGYAAEMVILNEDLEVVELITE
ncbi:MAG: N-acetylglucosamine-6-phosphate deacetylase [Filimonas sp.]|nr:N-acetylglucosamine-6-phosphate deacetylase [Filimonas sp.]